MIFNITWILKIMVFWWIFISANFENQWFLSFFAFQLLQTQSIDTGLKGPPNLKVMFKIPKMGHLPNPEVWHHNKHLSSISLQRTSATDHLAEIPAHSFWFELAYLTSEWQSIFELWPYKGLESTKILSWLRDTPVLLRMIFPCSLLILISVSCCLQTCGLATQNLSLWCWCVPLLLLYTSLRSIGYSTCQGQRYELFSPKREYLSPI